jgi:hypothetical protein
LASDARTRSELPDRELLDAHLGPDRFAIYPWPLPRPKDFTHLPESRKAWKRAEDTRWAAAYIDDDADNWYMYGNDGDIRCIASTWVNRAKWALRKGASWAVFEEEEKATYVEAIARATCPVVLSNVLRMAVFDVLQRRLLEEIWLSAPNEERPGLVRLQVGRPPLARLAQGPVDSAMPSPAVPGSRYADRRFEMPTRQEFAKGIKGWSVDKQGVRQPFYEGETEAPVSVVEQRNREMAARRGGR